MRLLRRMYRIPVLIIWMACRGIVSMVVSSQKDREKAGRDMAHQTQIWGKGLLRIFGIELHIHGSLEEYSKHGGLVVSNHMGYIDIFVHAACFGLKFTPKSDIRSWPVLGWYVGLSLPIWIDRRSKQSSADTLELFRETLNSNVPLIVYPEGTSTDGKSGLLPFKSTPFETVVGTRIPVQPVVTVYSMSEGDTTPCWYGDMELLPHVWAVLGNKSMRADVYIQPQVQAEDRDRKALARLVQEQMQNAYNQVRAELEERKA